MLLTCLMAGSLCHATEGDFSALLDAAGVDAASLDLLMDADVDWVRDKELPGYAKRESTISQILYRLEQLDDHQRRQWSEATQDEIPGAAVPPVWQELRPSQGNLVRLQGTITQYQELSSSPKQPSGRSRPRYACQLQLNGQAGPTITLLTPKIPSYWKQLPQQDFTQPVQLLAVVLGETATERGRQPVVLADHLQWYPVDGVPEDWIHLASAGYDVGLLDEVRHRRPFVKRRVSNEPMAFRQLLITTDTALRGKLVPLARQMLAHRQEQWQHEANQLREQLADLALPSRKKQQRRLQILNVTLAQAEQGRYSVAPMFLYPEEETGRLVLLAGNARRAVRIVADQPDQSDYYEVEIFTSDSQNLPIVCCVSTLPDGFPTGDAIRMPVRVAGVFLKNWRYRTRDTVERSNSVVDERTIHTSTKLSSNYAPVVVADSLQILKTSQTAAWSSAGLYVGLAVIASLACLWLFIWRLSHQDRLARRARSG